MLSILVDGYQLQLKAVSFKRVGLVGTEYIFF